jgi:hypothetical protein
MRDQHADPAYLANAPSARTIRQRADRQQKPSQRLGAEPKTGAGNDARDDIGKRGRIVRTHGIFGDRHVIGDDGVWLRLAVFHDLHTVAPLPGGLRRRRACMWPAVSCDARIADARAKNVKSMACGTTQAKRNGT